MEERVSIIVPVYNVKTYLEDCVNSLIKQTYKNTEIILVDDGSTDGSAELCDLLAESDDKIQVVHKNNAGLGMARNTGLEKAVGKYIMFIDSDDYLDENAVKEMYIKLQREQVDAVFCGMKRFSKGKVLGEVQRKFYDNIFRGKDGIKQFLLEMTGTEPDEEVDSYLYMSVCTGMYKISIIKENNIRFYSERDLISEDYIFNIDYFSVAESVGFIPGNYYYYRINTNSLTRSYNPDRFIKNIVLYEFLLKRLELLYAREDYKNRLDRMFLGRVRNSIVQSINAMHPLREIKNICNNSVVCNVLKTYPYLKNPLKQRIFNFMIKYKITGLLYFTSKLYTIKGQT